MAIIGGGLAGLTLAVQMADAGHSTVLFEKNKYPFHKVCGEYISNESWNFLERIGIPLNQLDLPQIRQLNVSSPSGNAMSHRLEQGGFGISRYSLDKKLADLAKEKGVMVFDGCTVKEIDFNTNEFHISTEQGIYKAEICVGSWGKKSMLDTRLGRKFTLGTKPEKNYVGIKYHVRIPFPDDLIELHNFENGYCGISRIEDGKCCLCYLCDSDDLKRHKGDIRKMEEELLMKNPFLKKYFNEAEFLFDAPLAISQIRIGEKSAVEDHILMLGDTAGNIAPLSGNGMSMAMRSSHALAGMLTHYFSAGNDRAKLEHSYTRFWRSQFRIRIKFSVLLQGMLKNTSLTNLTISALKTIPFLRKAIVRATHGKPF